MSKNAVTQYRTGLAKAQETFVGMIQNSAQEMALAYDNYQISCARNMMSSMIDLLNKDGLTINDIDPNNVTDILQTVAMLKLNPAATPAEVYVILRSEQVGPHNNKKWVKKFEMGIEGDGNDKILREYGVGIQKVHNVWIVREGDDFTYPSFAGLEITPPTWTPKSYTGKVLRVVYPIEMEDGSVEFHIAEREEVSNNLKAHISNNLMKNKSYTADAKAKILSEIADMTLDQVYQHEESLKIMSPAWRSAHSREAMILRKMRNNATKKIPKDFKSSFVEAAHKETFDDYDQYKDAITVDSVERVDEEFEQLANTEEIEIENINTSDDEVEPDTDKEVTDAEFTEVEKEQPKKKKKTAPFA